MQNDQERTSHQVWEELAPEFERLFEEFKAKGETDYLYSKIYKTYTSCHAQEYEMTLDILNVDEMKSLERPINHKRLSVYTHEHHGLTFTITREAIQDNLYKPLFYDNVVNLFEAYDIEREKAAAAVFNKAFEGKDPLYPVMHGNMFSEHLCGYSLEDALLEIAKYPGAKKLEVVSLLVPVSLQFRARRILKSFHEENQDFNIRLLVNKYLHQQDSWFLLTDAPHGFKHFEREADHVDSWVDQMTDNLIFKISGRYSFGFSNPFSVFGSTGTR